MNGARDDHFMDVASSSWTRTGQCNMYSVTTTAGRSSNGVVGNGTTINSTNEAYLFHTVDLHVWVGVHPAVTVAGHCGGALFDGPVAAVAHEAHHGDDHGQHRSDRKDSRVQDGSMK